LLTVESIPNVLLAYKLDVVKKIFACFCCFAFIVLAFFDINAFVDAGRRGVLLFGRNVMPVLFPFFFVSGLLVELGFFGAFRKFGRAAPIFALSLLGGYPTGARLLADLHVKGEITRSEAIRIATYTSTCSPIFVIATLGACFYGSIAVGVLVFVTHAAGAMVNGVLYRVILSRTHPRRRRIFVNPEPSQRVQKDPSQAQDDISVAISNSLYSAIQNIFAVGGLIVVFFIATNMIGGGVFISGLLEMTNGVFQASIATPKSLILPCAIISFGGLCVAMQGFVFMSKFKMPLWFYFLYKVTHTIFAVGSILVLVRIF